MTDDTIVQFMKEQAARCSNPSELESVMRGVQWAAFADRSLLWKVDIDRFARTGGLASVVDLDHGAADKLRWFISPAKGAACILRVLFQCPAADIAAVRMRDVALDGEHVSVRGR